MLDLFELIGVVQIEIIEEENSNKEAMYSLDQHVFYSKSEMNERDQQKRDVYYIRMHHQTEGLRAKNMSQCPAVITSAFTQQLPQTKSTSV